MQHLNAILAILALYVIVPAAASPSAAYMRQGQKELDEYNRLRSAGNIGATAYQSAYDAVGSFTRALGSLRTDQPEYAECRRALRELFPVMSDGAYYFANMDRQDLVLRYACAHIDISLLPAFAGAGLETHPSYPVLSNLAATNLYNRGEYKRAMDYFKAYLNTTDTANRELAFEGLARCYYEQKDYDWAAYIASQGTTHYPRNWNMLLIGIESYGHSGNDDKMAVLLERALAMNPGHKGLLEYQGKLLERQKEFAEAAAVFERLCSLNDMSLDYALHQGFNLYNAGATTMQASMAPERSKEEANALAARARQYFGKAAPVLRRVLDNTPYAANVARALAMCYAKTNDNDRLQKANESLGALRVGAVGLNEIPMLDLSYKPTVETAPVAVAGADAVRPSSDVDINIPQTSRRNDKTYVVVIGNENYKHHSNVPYAHNDAKVFAEYCQKALGVPQDNIRQCYDATLSEIKEHVKYLEKRSGISPDQLNVIFYYAGHGIPDVSNSAAYLLPADATGTDFESCFSLNDLNDRLNAMPLRQCTVFLDACFSGATRDNEMLFAERFVEFEVEDLVSKGNTVVFSATTGKQTAMGYDEQNHGFFTYYLLKALQESKGEICLKDLADNICTNVAAKSLDKKNKAQTPQVNPAATLGDSWKTRKLF